MENRATPPTPPTRHAALHYWRRLWRHARHHTDTLVLGRDPEIAAPKPTDWLALALNVVALKHVASELRKMIAVSITGRLDDEERTYVPESEWPKVVRESRCRLRTGARWPPTRRSCRRWSGTCAPSDYVVRPVPDAASA
ncbi:hypothetical protein WL80_02585 [Burkholderia ubonensis]|nr:hypothetical protein WL80_02585 [Burkholderia ubonensis]